MTVNNAHRPPEFDMMGLPPGDMRRTKMAQRVEIETVDDIDGSPGAETVSFGLDNQHYAIDLGADNAAALRMILAEYVAVARKAGAVKRPAGERMPREEAQAIRAWARANNYHPAERGRIPSAVVEAYRAAA
jgi:hypothetical protein